MKKKHIIALACVLALVVSLMSSFAFAAVPEAEVKVAEAGDTARSPYRCYTTQRTPLFEKATVSSSIVRSLSANYELNIESSGHTSTFKHVNIPSDTSVKGYVQRAHIVEPG